MEEKENKVKEKLDELNVRYYIKFSDLNENFSFLPEKQYTMTSDVLHKEYAREYEILDGQKGIDVDVEIEQLKIEREKKLEAVRIEREKLLREIEEAKHETEKIKKAAELEHEAELQKLIEEQKYKIELERLEYKQEETRLRQELADKQTAMLAELKLEAEKQEAEIERKRIKQNDEFDILLQTSVQEMRIKMNSIIPDFRRRFKIGKLEFGRLVPNQAMRLALQTANLDVQEYLSDREVSIADKRDTLLRKLGIDLDEKQEEELTVLSKKEWAGLFKRISKLPFAVVATIEAELQKQITAAEEQMLTEAKCGPMDEKKEQQILEEMEAERKAEEKEERAAEKAERKEKRKRVKAAKKQLKEIIREADGETTAKAFEEPENAVLAADTPEPEEEEPDGKNSPAEGKKTDVEGG